MGKALVINGINAAVCGLGKVEIQKTKVIDDFIIYGNESNNLWYYNWGSGNPYTIVNANQISINAKCRIIILDVTNIVGKKINIYSRHPYYDGAYYAAFASQLNFNPETIQQTQFIRNAIVSVKDFNISGNDGYPAVKQIEVPSDAKYLLYTTQTQIESGYELSDTYIELVE